MSAKKLQSTLPTKMIMKFLKKNLKYEISEGANLFESKQSIDA